MLKLLKKSFISYTTVNLNVIRFIQKVVFGRHARIYLFSKIVVCRLLKYVEAYTI